MDGTIWHEELLGLHFECSHQLGELIYDDPDVLGTLETPNFRCMVKLKICKLNLE